MEYKKYLPLHIIPITFLALVLRLYLIVTQPIWLDEAFTWKYAAQSFLGIYQNIASDCHPPLFYWLEHFVLMHGVNEFTLRILPVLIGVATIPVAYFWGRELLGEHIGLALAFLLAISPMHVFYSVEARMYTLWLFLFLVSLVFYQRKQWYWFGLFSALALWAHFLAIIPYLVLLVINRDSLRSLLVYVPGVVLLIPAAITIFTTRTSGPLTWGYQWNTLLAESFVRLYGWLLVPALAVFLVSVPGWYLLFRDDRSKLMPLVMLLFGVGVATMVLSFRMPMEPRYLIVLLPIVLLPAAVSIVRMPRWWATIAFIVVVISSAVTLVWWTQSPIKDDWRSISGYVDGMDSELPVAFYPEYQNISYQFYTRTQRPIVPLEEVFNHHGIVVQTWDYNLSTLPDDAGMVFLRDYAEKKYEKTGIVVWKV